MKHRQLRDTSAERTPIVGARELAAARRYASLGQPLGVRLQQRLRIKQPVRWRVPERQQRVLDGRLSRVAELLARGGERVRRRLRDRQQRGAQLRTERRKILFERP